MGRYAIGAPRDDRLDQPPNYTDEQTPQSTELSQALGPTP
jgi:hypothetical protein